LDVSVFRHGKLAQTVDEYCAKQQQQQQQQQQNLSSEDPSSSVSSREEVLTILTRDTFDNPLLKQFYAVFNEEEETAAAAADLLPDFPPGFLERTNGVMGGIDAVIAVTNNNSNNDLSLLELKNLRVHDAARRQGVGRALMQAAQEYATRKSATVYLQVDPDNTGAVRLYQQMGFVADDSDNPSRMTWGGGNKKGANCRELV
jgi:ribosomal protein S18 acetylase RimI-like enzyme